MRKIILSLMLVLFSGLIFGQTLKKGMVAAFNAYDLTLRDNVSLDQFIRFNEEKYIPESEKAMPGTKMYQLIGDRGENKFHFGILQVFDDLATRNKYYPVENDTVASPAIMAIAPTLNALSQEAGKYILNTERIYTDWITGETSGINLNKGTVIALGSNDVTLKDNITFKDYMDFTEKKYNPAMEAAMPGLKIVTLRGDRGDQKFHSGEMWIFDNIDVRNKYFPSENDTQYSPALQNALDKMKVLIEENNNYVINSNRTYTDWIIR
ncbi:MAG TPA: hypothetical protein VK155_00555 [Bacteroidales bacterium]|nr:hypothetical protein [Bacteroidales bacterium]